MKTVIYIFTFLLAFATTSFANDGMHKVYAGYVVTAKGDTLNGNIQMLSPTLNEVKVKLTSAEGQTTIFKAKELTGYTFFYKKYNKQLKKRVNEEVVYVRKKAKQSAIPFGSKEILMERFITGTVNVYNFYFEIRTNRTTPYDHAFYIERGKKMIQVDRNNFKKVVRNMVKDYPELEAKVGRKGYGYKHLPEIMKEYNNYNSSKGQIIGMR